MNTVLSTSETRTVQRPFFQNTAKRAIKPVAKSLTILLTIAGSLYTAQAQVGQSQPYMEVNNRVRSLPAVRSVPAMQSQPRPTTTVSNTYSNLVDRTMQAMPVQPMPVHYMAQSNVQIGTQSKDVQFDSVQSIPRIPTKPMPEINQNRGNQSTGQAGQVGKVGQTGTPPKFATATPEQIAQASQSVRVYPKVPMPQVSVDNVVMEQTVLIPLNQSATGTLEVSKLDEFLADVSPNARHYPSNFPNRTQQYNTRETIKAFVNWIEPFASAPDASYEVLIRSAQLNGMARNLDLGSEYAVRGSNHVSRALDVNPNSVEANLLYGIMLAEGGGFTTGRKYLDRGVELGSVEAEQSIAQADLLNDKSEEALLRLTDLAMRYPNNAMIKQQIDIINGGGYYIWDIADNDINVQAIN